MLNVQNKIRLWKLPKKNDIMKKKNLKKAHMGWDANLCFQPSLFGKDIESKTNTDISANGPTELLTQSENWRYFSPLRQLRT